jgi:glutamine synthetase
MVKSVAEKHGLRATFMPKPIESLTGNGCHAHISVWDLKAKKNVFASKKSDIGLSKEGLNFLGGIINHAKAMTAVTNPTVNSYKRINASRTLSGASWSPNTITWTGNNRTHMVRVPDTGRIELRLPDGAANPYLLQAAIITAGLNGVDKKLNPGERSNANMYEDAKAIAKAEKLPLNLLDALRAFDKDKSFKEGLGKDFSDSFVKLKMEEWHSYTSHFSEWEKRNTLDI